LQEVEVRALVNDPQTESPVLLLQGRGKRKALPMWIGISEATAIIIALEKQIPPRPLTWDLISSIIPALEGELEQVVIEGIHEEVYYASLYIRDRGGAVQQIDARPSDAVALALRAGCPIYVAEEVFEEQARELWEGEEPGSFYF